MPLTYAVHYWAEGVKDETISLEKKISKIRKIELLTYLSRPVDRLIQVFTTPFFFSKFYYKTYVRSFQRRYGDNWEPSNLLKLNLIAKSSLIGVVAGFGDGLVSGSIRCIIDLTGVNSLIGFFSIGMEKANPFLGKNGPSINMGLVSRRLKAMQTIHPYLPGKKIQGESLLDESLSILCLTNIFGLLV